MCVDPPNAHESDKCTKISFLYLRVLSVCKFLNVSVSRIGPNFVSPHESLDRAKINLLDVLESHESVHESIRRREPRFW